MIYESRNRRNDGPAPIVTGKGRVVTMLAKTYLRREKSVLEIALDKRRKTPRNQATET